MKESAVIPVGLALLMLTSCASTSPISIEYNASTGDTSYESKRTIMGYRDMTAGLAYNQRVMWQALASCAGEECVPDEVWIAFFNDTSRDLNLDYRKLKLIVDKVTHEWEDESRVNDNPNSRVPPGEFVRISLSRADFMNLAIAKNVEVHMGESGSSVFRISFERRSDFRMFAEHSGM